LFTYLAYGRPYAHRAVAGAPAWLPGPRNDCSI